MKNTPESISGSVERYFVTRCRNSGSALPLVILAVVMLLIMGTTLLSMGLNNRIYSLRNTSDIVARCAADAGLTQALFDMNQRLQAKTLNGQTMPYVYKRNLIDCDAHYSYLVTSNSGVYTIVSFGETENSQRIITAALGLQGIFDHAILTKDSLILKSGTTVDGYNSSDSSVTDVPVKIGTQSTEDDKIVLNNSVIVDGDVAVGMNGSVDDVIKDLGAIVNGDKHVATSIEPLPEITVPPLAEMGTSLTVKSSTLSLTEADSGTYSKIDLQNGKNIGVLEVAAGENVELHITGDIDLGQELQQWKRYKHRGSAGKSCYPAVVCYRRRRTVPRYKSQIRLDWNHLRSKCRCGPLCRRGRLRLCGRRFIRVQGGRQLSL